MSRDVPSLRHNFLWTLSGNIIYAACLWGLLVVLTKLGSPGLVGRFSLASAVATPIFVFANLQLRAVLVSDARDEHEFRDYLGVRLLMFPLALAVIAVAAVLGYSGAQVAAIMLFGLARGVESLSDIFYGYAQKNERMDLVARSMIIKGIASLALFAGAFYWTRDLLPALGAMVAGWVVPLLVFDIPRCRAHMSGVGESLAGLRPRWRMPSVRGIVWTALPLGLVMLMIQLRNTIPRTLLENGHGEEMLGIFSALAYIVIAGNMVVLALSQSSIARLSRAHAAGDMDAFRATVIKLVYVGLLIGAAGVGVAKVAGGPILSFLYDPEYALYGDTFLIIMAAGGISYVGSLLGAPATAMRAFGAQLKVHSVNTVVLLALGWFLIPRYGMTGAAWTMLGGATTVTVSYAFIVVRGMAAAHRGPTNVGGEA